MNELEKMLEHIAKREISAVAEYAESHNLDICVRDNEADWFWEYGVWRAYPETHWIKEAEDYIGTDKFSHLLNPPHPPKTDYFVTVLNQLCDRRKA